MGIRDNSKKGNEETQWKEEVKSILKVIRGKNYNDKSVFSSVLMCDNIVDSLRPKLFCMIND